MNHPHVNFRPLALSILLVFSQGISLSGCGNSANLSAEQHIERAKDFQSKGDTRASVLELKNAVQKAPNNPQARWLLGLIYLDLKLGADAESQLNKAIELGVEPKNALIPLARAQYYRGNFQDSLKTLATFNTSESGQLAQVLEVRGLAHLAMGNFKEGCASFTQSISYDATYAPAYVGRARCQFNDKEIQAAIESARHATTLDPEYQQSWITLGDLYRAGDQTDQAVTAYNRALKIKPNDFDALAYKTMALLSAKRMDEANKSLKLMEEIRPEAPLFKYLKAYTLYQQGSNTEAANLLQQALKDNPKNPQVQLLYGTVNYVLGNNEIALTSFNKTLSVIDHPDARLLLAATQLRMRANEDVLKTLSPFIAQGSNAKAFLLAGQAALNLQQFDQGMAYLERAGTLNPKDSIIRTVLAQNQLASGMQEGIRGLESVISDNPNDNQAYLLLAAGQTGKGDYSGALATLGKMASNQPSNPLPHVLIGRIHLMQKNVTAARNAFEHGLRIDGGFLPAASALADLDIQAEKPEQAKDRFKRILSKAPENLGARMGLARVALALNDFKEYESNLRVAVESHPTAIEPLQALTFYHIKQARQPKIALEIAQKAAQKNKGNAAFQDILGQAFLSAGRSKDAIDTYMAITNSQPSSSIAWYKLGWAQRVAGDIGAALNSLERSIRLAPDNLDARIALAGVYAANGQPDKAFQTARSIQEMAPHQADGYNLEAELASRLKKPEIALQAKARAFEHAASSETAATYHLALLRAGRDSDAEKIAQKWLSQKPTDANFRYYLAGSYLHKNLPQQAIMQYRQIVLSNPRHLGALNNLASLLQAQNDPNAIQFAKRAYEIDPANPSVMDTYGWALFLQGKSQEALPLLERAARQAKPENPDINYHYASALAKAGKNIEAQDLLRNTLKSNSNFGERTNAQSLLNALSKTSQ